MRYKTLLFMTTIDIKHGIRAAEKGQLSNSELRCLFQSLVDSKLIYEAPDAWVESAADFVNHKLIGRFGRN